MEKTSSTDIQLPPGFRFHPSDEELIVYFLRNKATSSPLPASIIAEVDLYKFNPWDLPRKALFGEKEWYFFTPRNRKYPNGVRPNRMAGSGYWKATGADKPIVSSRDATVLGVKKSLMFHIGRPPRGLKTDWNMHEYRIPEATMLNSRQKGFMRLDDWVLCQVWQKSNIPINSGDDRYGSNNDSFGNSQKEYKPCSTNEKVKLEMVRDFLDRDCVVLPLIFASQDLPSLDTVSNLSFEAGKSENFSGTNYLHYSVLPYDSFAVGWKRKVVEGDQRESFIQPNKKLINRDDQLSDVTTELNFCCKNGSEGNNFKASPWCSAIHYQEVNHLAFTEGD